MFRPPLSFYDVINALGLTGGLKLVLDAGDVSSYSSGQSWLDLSGNGYDFYLGDTSSSESSDPTFNGTPGNLSTSEYFAFDGGDYFIYDSANETWMQNIHKDNAKFTICIWFKFGTQDHALIGDAGNSNGFIFEISSKNDI